MSANLGFSTFRATPPGVGDTPQASNWRYTVNTVTCSSCHDNVNFVTGENHGGVDVAAGPDVDGPQLTFALEGAPAGARINVDATAVGRVIAGGGLTLCNGDAPVKLPPTLGYQHH